MLCENGKNNTCKGGDWDRFWKEANFKEDEFKRGPCGEKGINRKHSEVCMYDTYKGECMQSC